MSRLHLVFAALLVMGISGCGLTGWQGDPPSEPFLGVTGVVASVEGAERGTIWVIEADTASYVPKNDLPPQFREEGLEVQATGIVGDPPSFYPEGYYYEIRTMKPISTDE